MSTPKLTPGASRLPIPSRFDVRSSNSPITPSPSTPRTRGDVGTPTVGLIITGHDTPTPRMPTGKSSMIQRPKYQLQDPGVSSPIATAVKGGGSSLPRLQRPTPSSKINSVPASRTSAASAGTPLAPSTMRSRGGRAGTIRPTESASSARKSVAPRRSGMEDNAVSRDYTPKPSSIARSGRSSIPVPQRRAVVPQVANTPRHQDIPSTPKPRFPRTGTRTTTCIKSPLPLTQTPRHFYPPAPGTPVTDIDVEKTPTMQSRQPSSTSISAVSSTSTTTSAYSSASSMARARAAEAERTRLIRQDTDIPSNTESGCAPFLVPQNGPEMTLAWQPDTESVDRDPAEEVWKTLERKMGRRLRGESVSDRGRWVVQALREGYEPPIVLGTIARNDSCGMVKTLSEFTVSAYSSMTDDEGTALFDMSAPLIPSVSSSAATPANTPCFRSDTLTRHRHIRRRHGASSMSRQLSTDSDLSHDSKASATTEESIKTDISQPVSGLMYRLDSHVISALSALQGAFDSPDLDVALGLDDEDLHGPNVWNGRDVPKREQEGGLGLGMHIRLSSVYTLPTLSRLRKAPKLEELFGSGIEGEGDVMMVKDLDTGVMRAM